MSTGPPGYGGTLPPFTGGGQYGAGQTGGGQYGSGPPTSGGNSYGGASSGAGQYGLTPPPPPPPGSYLPPPTGGGGLYNGNQHLGAPTRYGASNGDQSLGPPTQYGGETRSQPQNPFMVHQIKEAVEKTSHEVTQVYDIELPVRFDENDVVQGVRYSHLER